MAKIILDDDSTNLNPLVFNENFRKIEEALNEKVLWRNNPEGEPNELMSDVDMNGKRLYNLPKPIYDHEPIRYEDIKDIQNEAEQAAQSAKISEELAEKAYQETLATLSMAGYTVIGDYAAGLEITFYNQIFRYNGEFYKASASLDLPYTTTGVWGDESSNFVSVGDAALRQDLASTDPGKGAAMVGVARGLLSESYISLTPKNIGAIPNDDSPGAIAINNLALQEYADYCLARDLTLDLRGETYYYDQTLDLTAERVSKIIGDCSDPNNVGKYNLIYLGTGTAIQAAALYHANLGLAGTRSVVDSIPIGTTAIQCSESMVHRDSNIRNFDTIYKPTGGYYSKVNGGTLMRARIIYDYRNVPPYNIELNARHAAFGIGFYGFGGAGPIVLAGSWEQWTEAIVKVQDEFNDRFGVTLQGVYVENYPTVDVAAGLTSHNGKYSAPNAFVTGNGSIKGTGTIYINGITQSVFKTVHPRIVDITADVYDTGVDRPTSIFTGSECDSISIKNDYRGDFTGVAPVASGFLSGLLSSGFWTIPGGGFRVPSSNIAASLLNGWIATTGPFITSNNGYVTLSGSLNGSAATSNIALVLPEALRPINGITAAALSNNPTKSYAAQAIVSNGGNVIIRDADQVDYQSIYHFSVTFPS